MTIPASILFLRIILSFEIIVLTGSITKTEGSGELKSGLLVFSDCMYFVFRVKIFHHPFFFFLFCDDTGLFVC